MIKRQITAAMELLLRVSLCLLTFIGKSLGVCPKPNLTTEGIFNDGIRVMCSVSGALKVEMELYNIVNGTVDQPVYNGTSQNPQYFTFSVTKKGDYRCVVKQNEYCQQLFSDTLLQIPDLFAEEGNDIILPCSCSKKVDLTQQYFDWKKVGGKEVFLYDNGKHYNNGTAGQDESFKNRVVFFKDELKSGNASIRISKTKQDDRGIYSCGFPKLKPPELCYIELVVDCTYLKNMTGERPGVCPKPTLSTKKTADGIRVICSVPDVSKVEMELHNRANESVGQLVDAVTSQNPQYFMFSITKDGDYRCLVKQKEYCHQLYSVENSVQTPGYSNAAVIGLGVGLGVPLVVAIIVIAVLCKRNHSDINTIMRCLGREGNTVKSTGDRTNFARSEDPLQEDSKLNDEA